MKLTKLCIPLFLTLLLASCSQYNYVSNLPSTPSFEEAGEVKAGLGLGLRHSEFQVAAAPLSFLGFTYTQFNGYGPHCGTQVQNSTIHLYHGFLKKRLFVDLNFGIGKGNIGSNNVQLPLAKNLESIYFGSKFSKQQLGLNLYSSLGQEKNIQLGIGVFYQDIHFSALEWKHEEYGVGSEHIILNSPANAHYLSPVLSLQILFPNASYLYFKQNLGFDYALQGESFAATLSKTGLMAPPSGNSYSSATLSPTRSRLFYSATIGLNINAYKGIRHLFSKR